MNICVKCRGRKLLCGLPRCPAGERVASFSLALRKVASGKVFGSTPPAAVVGESGWPNVRVYVGEPPGVFGEEARKFDAPEELWGLSLEEIAKLRSYVVFGARRVSSPRELGELAYAAVSERPVDVEMKLAKFPSQTLRFDLFEKPVGPTAPLREAKLASNPRLHPRLDSLIDDDVAASEAAVELYSRGVDVYTIQRAMSLGLLGARWRRRLVPSRWSITAVDVAVGNWLAERVRHLPEMGEPLYGFGEYLDNAYLVVVAPGPLSFVYLERWTSSAGVKEVLVREDVRGRRSQVDGGFEAARLAILEKLFATGKRGSVAVVRRVGEGYYFSVGNWQIRETIRRIVLKRLDESYLKYVERVGTDPLTLTRRRRKLDEFS